MSNIFADRVKETSTTTGTGTLTLAGAVVGYQSFAVVGNGNTCYYTILDGTAWEVGLGTYTLSGTTLSRDTVLASTNSGSKISLSGANEQVWLDFPAAVAALTSIVRGGTGQSTAYAGLDALMVQGADIASASTTNIGAATGQQITITGTTTITGFDTVASGVLRSVRFSGVLTLTYNATSLILPGAANITTAAGDTMIVESLGSGNWRCWTYQRAASPPPSGTNTGDQTITLTGDVTGSGTGSFAATLKNTGPGAGSYTNTNVTIDDQGRVTAIGNGSAPNIIINGGFDFGQRFTSGSFATLGATDTYSADRWKVAWQTASTQFQQTILNGVSETGMEANCYGTLKQITGAGKFVWYQIVEGVNSIPLQGQTVIFQAKLKASGSKTIRIAILQLGASGTIDTIPNPINSAFGSNTVDPTWGSNVTVAGSAVSASVTTAWTLFSASATISTTAKNVIVAVWTDSQFSAADTLSMTEAQLTLGTGTRSWFPSPIADEMNRCQRYCRRFKASTTNGPILNATGNIAASTSARFYWQSLGMRSAPTLSTSTVSSTNLQSSSNFTPSAIALASGASGDAVEIRVTVSGATVGQSCALLDANSGTSFIQLDAEL